MACLVGLLNKCSSAAILGLILLAIQLPTGTGTYHRSEKVSGVCTVVVVLEVSAYLPNQMSVAIILMGLLSTLTSLYTG